MSGCECKPDRAQPSRKGTVRALFVASGKGKHVRVDSVGVIPAGFDGDYHSVPANRRQILLMSASILEEFQLEPGAIFENAVVDGIDVMSLSEGQRLRFGSAIVEVTIPCEPCGRMDRVRSGLRQALQNRRGMFVKVVNPGSVTIGDTVEVMPSPVTA